MAFCPECGKPAAAGATRCIHCGRELGSPEKKAGGPRFKGTMMMTAPSAAEQAAPANANASPPTVPRMSPPKPLTAPTAAAGAAPVQRKPGGNKATMIGAGIAPLIAAQQTAAQQAPQPAPAEPATQPEPANSHLALAETQASHVSPETDVDQAASANVHAPRQALGSSRAHAATLAMGAEPDAASDSSAAAPAAHGPSATDSAHMPRYLPGDPMAPQASQPSAAHLRAPRLRTEDDLPRVPVKDRKWVFVAVGAVVVLSMLLLLFGLLH